MLYFKNDTLSMAHEALKGYLVTSGFGTVQFIFVCFQLPSLTLMDKLFNSCVSDLCSHNGLISLLNNVRQEIHFYSGRSLSINLQNK